MPSFPDWSAAHPLIVHLPIGVLMVAWVPALLALIFRKRSGTWMSACVVFLAIGVVGCFLAVMSGEAAEDIVVVSSDVLDKAIHHHEETGERARNFFIPVLIIGAVLALFAGKEKRQAKVLLPLSVLFVLSYLVAAMNLMVAGHQGGLLVHYHGVLAPITPDQAPTAVQPNPADDLDEPDDD